MLTDFEDEIPVRLVFSTEITWSPDKIRGRTTYNSNAALYAKLENGETVFDVSVKLLT